MINKESIYLFLIASAMIGVAISYSNLYLFHIMLFIFAIVQIFLLKKNDFKLKFNFLKDGNTLFLLLMFIWYSFTLLWVDDYVYGIKYIFYIFCGISIASLIINYSIEVSKLNKLLNVLSILLIFELIISLIETFTSFRMPISSYSSVSSYFGKTPPEIYSYQSILLLSEFKPPTGFHWNTNDLAIKMVIALPFFLCSKKPYIKIIGLISIFTIIGMSASRAVFLGLVLIFCLYLILIKKRVFTLLWIWIATITLFFSINQLRDSENPRINELANSIEALKLYIRGDLDVGGSIEWRRELVDNGIKAFYGSYGLGLGAGGSTANQEKIGPVAGRFTSMHNFWVEILVEGGLFFAVLMFFWYSNLVYRLLIISRSVKNEKLSYYSQSLLLSMLAFIPSAVAASSTIYLFPMWIMFGLSISTINLSRKEYQNLPLIKTLKVYK